MPADNLVSRFLRSTQGRVLSVLLLSQVAVFYALPSTERVSLARPLQQLPATLADWNLVQEQKLETEVLDLLKADDTVSRVYQRANSDQIATLFVAFFKSQRAGVSPHSPKVCLPGAGWTPSESKDVTITVPGRPDPITVNHYIVSKENQRMVVLYWYQSRDRVVADEYSAKLYSMVDSMRYNRSDTSIVRVIVPAPAAYQDQADQVAVEFIQSVYPVVRTFLPS